MSKLPHAPVQSMALFTLSSTPQPSQRQRLRREHASKLRGLFTLGLAAVVEAIADDHYYCLPEALSSSFLAASSRAS
jgi:hypothetical protein